MLGNMMHDMNVPDDRSQPGIVLNTSYSNEKDSNESNRIREMITQHFYHPQKDRLKESIIQRIQNVVNKWVFNINVNERKIPEDVAHMQLARVLAFGSYYLGVSSVDGDVDLVCIAPNFVDRQRHFNGQLFDLISKMDGVTYENNIMDAKVPILTFEIDGISVDISFAQLSMETLPDDLDRDIPDKHLLSMEDKDRMSINGYRCNQLILKYVMDSAKDSMWAKRRFQDALKVIKIWARNNGIYQNRLGYLGGISWALMLAKVVQMFPNVELNRLLEEFFSQYSKWNWQTMDVSLAPLSQQEDRTKTKQDKAEMFIYTPAIPEYNSTDRVKKINVEIIIKKIKEANRIVQEEIKRGISGWDRLLRLEDFLNEYTRFIEIDLIRTEMDHTMREFQTQQDKLSVKLLSLFDTFSKDKPQKLEIRPWPTFYKKNDPLYPHCQAFLIGVRITGQFLSTFNFQQAIKDFAITQQKSLDSLQHCMIRIFQATREDLSDINFVEVEPDQESKEKEMQQQRQQTDQNSATQSFNQKRVLGGESGNQVSEFESQPSKKNKIETVAETSEANNPVINEKKQPAPEKQIENEDLDDYY